MQICTRMATAVRCKPAALARCPRIVATKPLVDEARDKGRSALVRDGALPGKPHRAQARSYAAERSGLAAHGAVADGTARPAPGINTNERRSALVRDGALPGKPHRARARSYAAERSRLAAHCAGAGVTARPAPGINTNERRSALVRDGRYRASLIARERAPTTLSAQALLRRARWQTSRRGPHPASTRMNVGAHLCAMGRYRESLIARERAPTLLQAQPSCATNSASCTALSAAPLRILSETIHRFRPRGCERSSRMRPTNTASWPEACVTGVG